MTSTAAQDIRRLERDLRRMRRTLSAIYEQQRAGGSPARADEGDWLAAQVDTIQQRLTGLYAQRYADLMANASTVAGGEL